MENIIALREEARLAYEKGKYKVAAAHYWDLTSHQPNDAESWLGLAESMCECHRLDEAVSAANKALSLKPDLGESYNILGYAALVRMKYLQALQILSKGQTIQPTNPKIASNLAVVYSYLGEYETALDMARLAVQLEPNEAFTHVNFGAALMRVQQLAEATDAYQTAFRVAPSLDTFDKLIEFYKLRYWLLNVVFNWWPIPVFGLSALTTEVIRRQVDDSIIAIVVAIFLIALPIVVVDLAYKLIIGAYRLIRREATPIQLIWMVFSVIVLSFMLLNFVPSLPVSWLLRTLQQR